MSHARTLWEEGREPGRQVVALGLACTLTAVVLDLAIGSDLGWLFDLAFVLVCAGIALAVRPRDFFVAGVLPPLLMVAAFTLLGIVSPGSIAHASDNVVQTVVTGLATHAGPLIVGYIACLGVLAVRHRFLGQRQLTVSD